MTTYIHVDVTHIGNSNWRAYVPLLDDFIHETSRPRLEYEVYRFVEKSQGLHSFTIIWREA